MPGLSAAAATLDEFFEVGELIYVIHFILLRTLSDSCEEMKLAESLLR